MLQTMLNKLRRRPQPQPPAAPTVIALANGWHLEVIDEPGFGEFCDPGRQSFIIELQGSLPHAVGHATAHLFFGHHEKDGDFTEQDCADADDRVRLWLDEFDITAFGEPAADGPPTIIGIAG